MGTSARAGRRNGESAITGIVESFLKRAQKRHITNLALEYLAVAGGAGAVGVIALLVLGRQILDWYWPVLLFLSALALGLSRARKRALSQYRLAQVVDARLGLDDRISTLVYFREQNVPADIVRTVENQATERLRSQSVPVAVPIVFPRYGYACAALLLTAGGLLALRYGILHTMDLHPPLANLQFAPMQPEPKAYAASRKSAIRERWDQQLKDLGVTPQDLETPDETSLKTKEQEVQAAANDPNAAPVQKQNGKKDMNAPSPEAGEQGENGDKSAGEKNDSSNGDSSDQKGEPASKQNSPQNAKQGQPGSQDGLMNKMRDALANLMNKLKNQDKQQDGQQQASNGQQQQQGQMGKQQQQGQQGKQQGEGQPGADQQSGEQNGEKTAGNKSKAGEKSDRPGDQNAKSGVGQQDGDKALREAQQLAAMGKISEIFGKRAQQLTGEMSVEVSSGKQQLKTQWSERKALHADTGAETNRNEIPLAYQSYVQRYFEEVRKSAGGAKGSNKGQVHP